MTRMNRRLTSLLSGIAPLVLALLATGCASSATVVPGHTLALASVEYPDGIRAVAVQAGEADADGPVRRVLPAGAREGEAVPGRRRPQPGCEVRRPREGLGEDRGAPPRRSGRRLPRRPPLGCAARADDGEGAPRERRHRGRGHRLLLPRRVRPRGDRLRRDREDPRDAAADRTLGQPPPGAPRRRHDAVPGPLGRDRRRGPPPRAGDPPEAAAKK